ncbi:SRPBCC family protein [Rhodococcus gannanensis]|uniref:SRPBCC family protein n=1 Tax=Rhodococcus gannanensis TaxID=1960308 RepID=A0ABW4P7A7_9NOCA
MAPKEIRLDRHVAASPDQVWAVLTDLDSAEQTLSGVTRVERVAGDGYEVGTRWRETRKMFGKEATEEMWVAEVDAPHRTVVKAHSSGTDYTTAFTVTGAGSGTDLTMVFSAEVGSPSFVTKLLMAVFGGIGTKATRKAMATDLDDIAARAEAAGR